MPLGQCSEYIPSTVNTAKQMTLYSTFFSTQNAITFVTHESDDDRRNVASYEDAECLTTKSFLVEKLSAR